MRLAAAAAPAQSNEHAGVRLRTDLVDDRFQVQSLERRGNAKAATFSVVRL